MNSPHGYNVKFYILKSVNFNIYFSYIYDNKEGLDLRKYLHTVLNTNDPVISPGGQSKMMSDQKLGVGLL